MSYRVVTPRAAVVPAWRPVVRPMPHTAIVPLADVPAPLAQTTHGDLLRKVVLGIVVVLLLIGVYWWFVEKSKKTKKNGESPRSEALQRVSTGELAKRLYDRLETRGGANPQTLRSLQRYARKA